MLLELGQRGLAEGLSGAVAEGHSQEAEGKKGVCIVSIYTYYIDRLQLFGFNESVVTGSRPSPQYRKLQHQLAR